MTFHTEQRRVFSKLLAGKNVVLSAPTSFGKTLLVDALIASKKPTNVVIVVPTIALLEERRRTLAKRFPNYQIITQSFQEPAGERIILVGTQERILERRSWPPPDLFVIDEFYKLDITNSDSRSNALNVVLASYIDTAKQVYLLGPSIETNPVDNEQRPDFEFVRTHYSPVAADIVRVDPPGSDPGVLARLLADEVRGTSLIYCRSPKSARVVSQNLRTRGITTDNTTAKRVASWLRENYHPNWYLADAVECGVGIHHGRVPRAVAHLMVQLFNSGDLKQLLCTSSLIEGVNTAAENVLIYDKYISTRKLDRFTFDNIKGRAGRMFRHYVGKVYLFAEMPEKAEIGLEIPLLKARDELSDQAIFNVPEERLSPRNLARKREITDRVEVPAPILEKYARFGIPEIESLYTELSSLLLAGDRTLLWSGVGTYYEALDSMEAVWGHVDFEKHNVRSAKQFAFFANRMRQAATLRQFIEDVSGGTDLDDKIDLTFNFLRGAEYSFVEPLKLLQAMVNSILGEGACDYSKFLADLSGWGLPGNTKALEELGVPAPVIQRVRDRIDIDDIDQAIEDIRSMMTLGTILSPDDILVLDRTLN